MSDISPEDDFNLDTNEWTNWGDGTTTEDSIVTDNRPHKPDCEKIIRNNGALIALSCTCYPIELEEV